MKLTNIFEDILKLEYMQNDRAKSGQYTFNHEKIIKNILLQYNLKLKTVKVPFKHIDDNDYIKNIINSEEFIYQPAGTQHPPDFIINYKNHIIRLGCKSNRSGTPTWNDNYPKESYIYIFTSKKYNATTFFFGEDVISPDVKAKLIEAKAKMMELRELFKDIDSNRGFRAIFRFKVEQYGKNKDYFKHKDRSKLEARVLSFIRSIDEGER